MTTNIDLLIEDVTGLPPVSWRSESATQVVRNAMRGVLHLFGHWRDPESVALGTAWQKTLRWISRQGEALRETRTVLFVGFSGFAEAPCFEPLAPWVDETFCGPDCRHFRLVRVDKDSQDQGRQTSYPSIRLLPVGPREEDLKEFLKALNQVAKLPPPPSLCTGREEEVKSIVTNLLRKESPRHTLVLGESGSGKSTIVLKALYDPAVRDRFGKRRYLVDCNGVQTFDVLIGKIAEAADVPLVGQERVPRVFKALQSEPSVLALDNAEIPWDGGTRPFEEFLAELADMPDAELADMPNVALVVTMNARQGPPPGTEHWAVIEAHPWMPPVAREVFLAVAGEWFRSEPHLDGLLQGVGWLPQHVVYMAQAAKNEPNLSGIWDRMQERPKFRPEDLLELVITSKGITQSPEVRRLLSLLGVLPDGIARGDLGSLLPEVGEAAAQVLERHELFLIESHPRLRVPTLLRSYAQLKFPPAEDDLSRAIDFYISLAEREGPGVDSSSRAVRRLAAEANNLKTMILKRLEPPEPELAVHAAIALIKFTDLTAQMTTEVLERALEVASDLDDKVNESRCLLGLAMIAQTQSSDDRAQGYFSNALPICQDLDDLDGVAKCLLGLGDVALARSDQDSARARYEEALKLFVDRKDELGRGHCIESLGEIAHQRSEYSRAVSYYREALDIFAQIHHIPGQASCTKSLGDIAMKFSDTTTAQQHYQRASELYQSIEMKLGEANCTTAWGDLALGYSDFDVAETKYLEAKRLYHFLRNVDGEANVIKSLGDVARERGDYERARAHYEEAEKLYVHHKMLLGQANCAQGLAYTAWSRSDRYSAYQLFSKSQLLYKELGDRHGQATCLKELGDIALERSDPGTASKYYEEALALAEQTDEPNLIGRVHLKLARVAASGTGERRIHARAAYSAWERVGSEALLASLRDEFPEELRGLRTAR